MLILLDDEEDDDEDDDVKDDKADTDSHCMRYTFFFWFGSLLHKMRNFLPNPCTI